MFVLTLCVRYALARVHSPVL